jgi:1,2-phenylacetyl-CoA epoxidase catalytic subunit
METVQELLLPKRHHDALADWQRRHFPDLPLLQQHWASYFSGDAPFRLCARTTALKTPCIGVGMLKGRPYFERAGEMLGNMLDAAVRIIKAQASAKLGSIQQHLATLDAGVGDWTKFSILRICADELRHAYQMFWVLSHDPTWAAAETHDIADRTIDELLAMSTGTHVLDAFNIHFHDPLDNIVFAFLIDRVGKYQLSMQKVFTYAPMARSMPTMLKEESFHLMTGHDLLRDLAVASGLERGKWTLAEIQRRINAWFPRAVELFGDPDGGQDNINFGFKDRLNGASLRAYTVEVASLLEQINIAVATVRHPERTRGVIEIMAKHARWRLHVPHVDFFRMRGSAAVAYQPIAADGRRLSHEEYWQHLEKVLPVALLGSQFFARYRVACVGVLGRSHEHRVASSVRTFGVARP